MTVRSYSIAFTSAATRAYRIRHRLRLTIAVAAALGLAACATSHGTGAAADTICGAAPREGRRYLSRGDSCAGSAGDPPSGARNVVRPARINRAELERREMITICFFNDDKALAGDESPGEKGRRVFAVTLTKGPLDPRGGFHHRPRPGRALVRRERRHRESQRLLPE